MRLKPARRFSRNFTSRDQPSTRTPGNGYTDALKNANCAVERRYPGPRAAATLSTQCWTDYFASSDLRGPPFAPSSGLPGRVSLATGWQMSLPALGKLAELLRWRQPLLHLTVYRHLVESSHNGPVRRPALDAGRMAFEHGAWTTRPGLPNRQPRSLGNCSRLRPAGVARPLAPSVVLLESRTGADDAARSPAATKRRHLHRRRHAVSSLSVPARSWKNATSWANWSAVRLSSAADHSSSAQANAHQIRSSLLVFALLTAGLFGALLHLSH